MLVLKVLYENYDSSYEQRFKSDRSISANQKSLERHMTGNYNTINYINLCLEMTCIKISVKKCYAGYHQQTQINKAKFSLVSRQPPMKCFRL